MNENKFSCTLGKIGQHYEVIIRSDDTEYIISDDYFKCVNVVGELVDLIYHLVQLLFH